MSRLNQSLFSLVAISAAENNMVNNALSSKICSINGIRTYTDAINNEDKTKRVHDAAEVLFNSDVVCFDVDSTVIIEEGIDELANYCGKGLEVAKLTKEAMGGSITFQDALRKRLEIIHPTQKQISEFLITKPSTLSPGIKELISQLKSKNILVYLITGGFQSLIEPVANEIGVPMDQVFANKLLFYYNGNYAGFDTTQPTSRSGGKGEAVQMIRKLRGECDLKITMVGDGATDLEASPPANNFIGYGGNVIREEVQRRAHYYITDFQQLQYKQQEHKRK